MTTTMKRKMKTGTKRTTFNESSISIRSFHTWDDYIAAEVLQQVVWQIPDWRDVVPGNLLITAHKNGGILVGAFDADEKMIGFAFSFLGIEGLNGKFILKHCSHMLAVLPEYRSQQIGVQLKLKQREIALAQGIPLMTWTYDPLLALNANLNLTRLGAFARHYIVSAYGEDVNDALNAGLPSDRFQVEWWMNSPRVQARAAHKPHALDWNESVRAGAQEIMHVAFESNALPHIERVDEPQSDSILIEIPSQLSAVKAASRDLALDWRLRTRELFQRVFEMGYIATDVVFTSSAGVTRAAYLLTRQPPDVGHS